MTVVTDLAKGKSAAIEIGDGSEITNVIEAAVK
jgi:hypothetical protein